MAANMIIGITIFTVTAIVIVIVSPIIAPRRGA